uniref:Uncharacterized protein n=1 Tax=Brassica campestris TaxID=3711 RepID=A0A3P6CRE8_BRACM|nr:unnamed protein product [Brassica rapa]
MLINVRKLDVWGILASINVNFQLMEKPLRATLPAMETVGLQNTSLNGHSNMSMAFRRSLVVYYFQIFELNKEVAEKNKET